MTRASRPFVHWRGYPTSTVVGTSSGIRILCGGGAGGAEGGVGAVRGLLGPVGNAGWTPWAAFIASRTQDLVDLPVDELSDKYVQAMKHVQVMASMLTGIHKR